MKPEKAKTFVKPTASKLDLSEVLVDDVVSFYWSTVQKALSNIDGASVTVANLGTFNVRFKRIRKLRARYNKYLTDDPVETMTFNKHSIKKLAEFKLERLEAMEKHFEEEKKRREETKQKRKQYVNTKSVEK